MKTKTLSLSLIMCMSLCLSVDTFAASYKSSGSSFRSSSSSSKSSFGSSKSSRPSFSSSKSSSSSKFGGSSKASSSDNSAKPKYKTNTAASSKFGKTYNDSINKAYAKQAAKKSYGYFEQKQAKPPKYFPTEDLTKYRTNYSSNSAYQRLRRNNSAVSERARYYQNQPPIVVNGGSDSFGMLSGMFLYSLLNNPASAGQYSYNHSNDPDYQAWRTEAEMLAKDNAELRDALTKLDAEKSKHSSTPNPDWLPDAVPLSATVSDSLIKAAQSDFRVCVGTVSGAYYQVAQKQMLPRLNDLVNIVPVPTQGTPEIMAKLADGSCDGGFVQGDAVLTDNVKPVFTSFLEAAHLACNTEVKGSSLNHLSGQPIWIPKNSGSKMTWDRWVALNPELDKLPVQEVLNYEVALLNASKPGKNAGCMFYMGAPHAAKIDQQINRKQVKLMAINDPVLANESTPYAIRLLDSSDYTHSIKSGFFKSGTVETLVTPTQFVISEAWRSANPDLGSKLELNLFDINEVLKKSVQQ